MGQPFGPLPQDEEMAKRGVTGQDTLSCDTPRVWKELVVVHQCQLEENSWLLQLLQQWAMFEQVASLLSHAKQQLWEQMMNVLAPFRGGGSRGP